ncbi:MAG: BREX-3 system P-loop-containing protein BrxF [Sporomusaceae bacterium]|nr:BREX-3 system P-loop-containing protein BrxF [Sporomusaceae bacterium]
MMVQHIVNFVNDTKDRDEKLVLIVGQPGSGKSKIMRELSSMRGWEYVDSRILVTEELLELMPKVRPVQAPLIMDNVLVELEAEVVLLDGIQTLFAPVLQLDPLKTLRRLSRNHMIVSAWPGQLENGKLVFNQDGRLPYREYDATGLNLVQVD